MALTYSETGIADADFAVLKPIKGSQGISLRDNPKASHKYVRRSAVGPTVTNSTTLVDDTVLEFAAEANQAYAFKIICYFVAASRGVRVAIDVPVACSLSAMMTGMDLAGTTRMAGTETPNMYFTTTDDDPGIFELVAGGTVNPGVIIEGLAANGANAGTVKLRYACGTAVGGQSVQIQAGSFLTYHRVDPLS